MRHTGQILSSKCMADVALLQGAINSRQEPVMLQTFSNSGESCGR